MLSTRFLQMVVHARRSFADLHLTAADKSVFDHLVERRIQASLGNEKIAVAPLDQRLNNLIAIHVPFLEQRQHKQRRGAALEGAFEISRSYVKPPCRFVFSERLYYIPPRKRMNY